MTKPGNNSNQIKALYLSERTCSILSQSESVFSKCKISNVETGEGEIMAFKTFVPTVNLQKLIENYNASKFDMTSKRNYNAIMASRMQLPAYSHRLIVCTLVKTNQIVLISGETGCGKSTQVPQYLLDDPDIGGYIFIRF